MKKASNRTVYVKDLIFTVLHHWKIVLILVLAGVLLLGIVQGIKGISEITNKAYAQVSNEAYEATMKEYEEQKSELVERVDEIKEVLSAQREILDNSVLMQLNPYGYYEASTVIYFTVPEQTSGTSDVGYVLNSYASTLMGSHVLEAMSEAVQVESRFLTDVYTVTVSEPTSTLTVTICYPQEEGARNLLACMKQQIEQIAPLAEHTLRILDAGVMYQADAELAEEQNKKWEQLSQTKTRMEEAQKAVNSLSMPTLSDASVASVLKKTAIFAVLGGVIAFFLTLLYFWVAHICSNRVYSARTLEDATGIQILGCMVATHSTNWIDTVFRKWEGRNLTDSIERGAILAQDIANRCPDIQKLAVLSLTEESGKEILLEALKKAMPAVTVTDCKNLHASIQTVDAFSACDKVLLVAQCHKSRYDEITVQLQAVEDYNKAFVGCVLLDG